VKVLKFILPLLVLGVLGSTIALAAINAPEDVVENVGVPTTLPNMNNTDANTIVRTIKNLRNWLAGILMIIAVAIILIGAFLYMTSGGDSTKTKAARGWIVGGVVGIVIAGFAFGIVSIVSNLIQDISGTTGVTPPTP